MQNPDIIFCIITPGHAALVGHYNNPVTLPVQPGNCFPAAGNPFHILFFMQIVLINIQDAVPVFSDIMILYISFNALKAKIEPAAILFQKYR